jgi:hypothetical protein
LLSFAPDLRIVLGQAQIVNNRRNLSLSIDPSLHRRSLQSFFVASSTSHEIPIPCAAAAAAAALLLNPSL